MMEHSLNIWARLGFYIINASATAVGELNWLIYNNIVFKIGIWDASGQEKYTSLLPIFIKDSDIIFIFYNCNNKNSFERAKFLLELAKKRNNIKDCIYALVGNKYDLNLSFNEKNNIIDDEEVLEFAEKNKLIYSHISILEKYSQGVNELFKNFLNEYLKIKNVEYFIFF